MAALLLLLLLLCSNIQAQVIRPAGWRHYFFLDGTADFCSVSRWTAEGTQLLFNSSASYYHIYPLDASHSGQYQQQCWTQGNLTLDRNSTLLVCDDQEMIRHETVELTVGETVELSCDGVGPNQSVHWAYDDYSTVGLASVDDRTPHGHQLQQLQNKASLLLTADRRADDYITYYCLEQQQLRCHLHSRFDVGVSAEWILRREGESLELNCPDGSRSQTYRWWMENSLVSDTKSLNSTLMLPSLTLNHTGRYNCLLGDAGHESYHLYVCPGPEPPAVQLFTEGEELTLHCGDWNQTGRVLWFMRSNRTRGRVSRVHEDHRPDNVHLPNSSLVMRNVSLQDSGQVWCVVMRGLFNCVFMSETLVKLREPEVDHLLLRSVLVSAVVLVLMLCVVGVVGLGVVWRGRRGEQLPAAVEEMEMSQLSPESEAQDEEPPPCL